MTWDEYQWEPWVPDSVRDELRRFWNPEWGRSPESWAENNAASYNRHPTLGTRVAVTGFDDKTIYEGRWVPMWNNIGRVIEDDGGVRCASTCRIDVLPAPTVSGDA